MASSNGVVRFVKCPKCYRVLAEFADVPVYKCGGCGAVLRAKVRASTTEKTVGGSLENNSQKPADSSSLVNESISLAKQTHTSASEVQKVVQSDPHLSNSNIVLDTTRKEVSEPEENRAERRPSESLESDVQSLLRRGDTNAEERTQASQEVFVDEVEKSLSPAPQDQHGSSVNEIVEEPSNNTSNGAVFIEEDTKLTSLAYDGSVSSRDEQEDRVPHKHLAKSKRTFRRQKSLSVDDTTRKSMNESTGKETQPQPQMRRSFARDTTFGSEDFHSVQNWMGSEIDDDLISIPSDLIFQGKSFKSSNANPSTKVNYLDSDQLKILRKVDELRDELSDFLTKTVEGKQASRLKPRTTRFVPKYSCLDRKGPMHKDEDEKHTKAKKPAVKQYYRPVYGGAPFVICYKCWKLLQLPADFLVTRKRLHKLQCGACSEVLVFSFRLRTHSAPHSPVEAQHPPSEVGQPNDYIQGGDFVSRSESFSSEPEPVHNVSRSSSYSITVGAKGSSLHGLMGYSSASELLFEPIRVTRGYESSQTTTPEFYRPPPRGDRRRYGQYGTGTSAAKSIEIDEEEESHEQITTRRRGSAIPGLLKKGVQELSNGLESMKLKIQSKG